jgi:GT2 family glycosyltransferase
VLHIPPSVGIPVSCEVECCVERATAAAVARPHVVTDLQIRETIFEYFASTVYFGNPQVETFCQMENGPGPELLAFSAAISERLTRLPYVERFGPNRTDFHGSIVVCLLGKPDFLFLQSALFSQGRDSGNYEFIYVSNSPELSETLQREAQIATRLYGVSLTLVFLPGNAGFGAANNAAVGYARSRRILIVNPDVFPRRDDWAQAHTQLVETLPPERTALFGVPLYYDDGSLMHAGMYFEADVGLSVRPEGISSQVLLRVEHYGKGAPPATSSFLCSRRVPAVSGAFMSVDRAWFEDLGGFSETYVYGHYEDADLCLKSLVKGRATWLHNIPFWHLEGKGSDRQLAHEGGSLINRWHFTRSWSRRISEDLCGREPLAFNPPRQPT